MTSKKASKRARVTTTEPVAAFRAQLDIATLVARLGVEVVVTRGKAKMRCAFHDEKTPSCLLDLSDNHFHCFGCDAHGDVFALVGHLRNCSYPETLDWISEVTGLPRPVQHPEAAARSAALRSLGTALAEGLAITGGSIPADLSPDLATSLGLGRGLGLAEAPTGSTHPFLTQDESVAWEGAWTLELRARGGVVGFGAFVSPGNTDSDPLGPFTPASSTGSAPSFGCLGAAGKIIAAAGQVVITPLMADALALQSQGVLNAIAPATPVMTQEVAEALVSLALWVVVAVRSEARKDGTAASWFAALLGAGAHVDIAAIDKAGQFIAGVDLFAYLARRAKTLPRVQEREQMLRPYLAAVASPSTRWINREWLAGQGVFDTPANANEECLAA